MHTKSNSRPTAVALFQEQVEKLNLHYDCRTCVHVDNSSGLCSMEYPNGMVWAASKTNTPYDEKDDLIFCKYYELT